MHDIEPFWNWRDRYIAEEDEYSPFYGREYNEFSFTNKIYNYFIHPQWDEFGSNTLYGKLIYVDYDKRYAIMELIGEWNDCLHNDIMFLKREVIDPLIARDIVKFVIIGENVLNFHGEDDSYYEEWFEEVIEEGGWIAFVNFLDHVITELADTRLQKYIHFDPPFNAINWRMLRPGNFVKALDAIIANPDSFRLGGY